MFVTNYNKIMTLNQSHKQSRSKSEENSVMYIPCVGTIGPSVKDTPFVAIKKKVMYSDRLRPCANSAISFFKAVAKRTSK